MRASPSPGKRAAVSAGLSIFFLVVYGGTNWLAAHREHVGTAFFQWELAIPFVSFFVLPYLSIDLFFIGAPFLCQDSGELRVWSARITFAIIVAGSCFAAFPLRCGFPPISREGWLGQIFGDFLNLDAPYNLAPSLHAALGLLLFLFYYGKTRGTLRLLVAIWFGLMALSPVLTHQHHLVDIATGLSLGIVSIGLVSPQGYERWIFSARFGANGKAIIPHPKLKMLCANTHSPSRLNSLGTPRPRG